MKKRHGFTLIEILIALSLTAIILGAIYATFFLADRAKESAGGSMLRLYEGQKIMDLMRRELEALTGHVQLIDKEYFGKQASGISFKGFSPKRGILSDIEYSIAEENGTLKLGKKEKVLGQKEARAVILDQIEEMKIEVNSGGKWVKAWEGDSPQLLRVTLSFPFKGRICTLIETVKPRMNKSL